jgi:hypothetical protein
LLAGFLAQRQPGLDDAKEVHKEVNKEVNRLTLSSVVGELMASATAPDFALPVTWLGLFPTGIRK